MYETENFMTALDFSLRPGQFTTPGEKKAAYDILAKRIDYDLAAVSHARRQMLRISAQEIVETIDKYYTDADRQCRAMLKMQVAPKWEDWKNS